ncbi:NUMOD4 domain-containing protein, partial [Hespellia stercorisuis]
GEKRMKEEWKTIERYNGKYLISNLGRCVSTIGKVNREMQTNFGFRLPSVYLNNGLTSAWVPVCYLVAEAFVDNPNGYVCVRFKNGDKRISRYTNLEWTESENV